LQDKITFRSFISRNSYLPLSALFCIFLSFVTDQFWQGNASAREAGVQVQDHVQRQEKAFDLLVTDTVAMNSMLNGNYDEVLLDRLSGARFFVYRYLLNGEGHPAMVFWSTQAVIPSDTLLSLPGRSGFVRLSNGYYVWRKVQDARSITLGLVPVKWNYFISNDYLQNTFATDKNMGPNFDVSVLPGKDMVRSVGGNALFSIVKKPGNPVLRNNDITVILRLLAVLLVLLFIHLCATFIALYRNVWKAGLFLLLTVVFLRAASYYLPLPVNLRQFELFNPSVYGSNVVLRSLGDLLVNTILFTWFILFMRHHLQEKKIMVPIKDNRKKWLLLAGVAFLFLLSSFTFGNIIRSMVADSQISFDVIDFFSLNLFSVIGFVVLCCLAIGYFLLSQVLLYLLRPFFSVYFYGLYLALAVGGLLYLSFRIFFDRAGFEIFILAWLMLYLFLLGKRDLVLQGNPVNSTRMVFWLFFFSLSITAVIVQENQVKELRNRKHYAETLSTKGDPSSETLMNTMLTDFRNEFIADNFSRLHNPASNQDFKDSLVQSNFSGYTDRYDTRIYTFDAAEKPLFNADSTGFNELNTVLNTEARPTGITDLYYYDESYDRFSYISKKKVTDANDSLLGYVFILANPKKNKSETLYPELFSKGHDNAIENSSTYSFATYNNLQLASSHNDYPFPTRITPDQVPKEDFEYINRKDYDELWYKSGPQKVVVIVKENNLAVESITLFSYLFCSFLLVTAVFWMLNVFIRSGLKRQRLKDYWQLSIRSQIHGTIIFISALSFLVIGISTILFFISRYQNNNRERLSLAIHVMENEVRTAMSDLSVFDDVMKVYDEGYRNKLEKIISKIAEIHAFDINLYDLDGNLQVSSLALPYTKGIVSKKMNPLAFYHLSKLKEVQYFREERIGTLQYVSYYMPVIDESGKEYAYLNIPHFTSESRLRQEISYFLVTIINLNAFIFLVAGILALFLTHRITRSFSFISEKMKAVNLGQMNEAINWNRNDEIGELVKEYNKMVGKLDASAAALAKSEREGAWREMARQVAHEIKNPLTPMKLSLQYLQKAITNKSDNVKELTANVAQTLVEQIDHLNQIAGEFSQFANIGNPHNEVFDLHESLKSVIRLHAMEEGVEMEWTGMPGPILINADRTHINRLFTNLIQNAIQSVPGSKKAQVQIKESELGDKILVSISDNGSGIPEAMQSRIFTPNFTTKTSGTGLGLAMCKGIVEQAGGEIGFVTKSGVGTEFFVKLPVVKEG
jgi:two-component system, NtrC family, nitrogen regulation sensor histidine kinase NtrY